jgi:predicted RNA-binding protein
VDFGGETKVANLDVDAVVDEDVARFEVPVDDVVLMQVLAPQQDLTKGQ